MSDKSSLVFLLVTEKIKQPAIIKVGQLLVNWVSFLDLEVQEMMQIWTHSASVPELLTSLNGNSLFTFNRPDIRRWRNETLCDKTTCPSLHTQWITTRSQISWLQPQELFRLPAVLSPCLPLHLWKVGAAGVPAIDLFPLIVWNKQLGSSGAQTPNYKDH